jgi:membrane-associated protease RseP (regulator of RpoE activity)
MNAPTRRQLGVAVGLFVATFVSSSVCYAYYMQEAWLDGVIFATCLLSILLAHELGHYFVARAHGFELTLPYFIPMPLPLGTMGAVISVSSPPRSRQALLEMGAAGPIAGMVVALAVLILGLPGITMPELPASGTPMALFRDPLIVKILGQWVNGEVPDPFARYGAVAWAGWVGCFLTGLNLVPLGQLDGGHVLNALSPAGARVAGRVIPWVLGAIGLAGIPDMWNASGGVPVLPSLPFGWVGWLPWLLLLGSFRGTEPLDTAPLEPPVPLRGRIIAAVTALLFVLTFLPAPTVTLPAP